MQRFLKKCVSPHHKHRRPAAPDETAASGSPMTEPEMLTHNKHLQQDHLLGTLRKLATPVVAARDIATVYFPGQSGKAAARHGQLSHTKSSQFRRVSSLQLPPLQGAVFACGVALTTVTATLSIVMYMQSKSNPIGQCVRQWACTTWSFQFTVCVLACLGTGAPRRSDLWTQSRISLEDAIQEEKEQTNSNWNDDLMDHEDRLEQRLSKLKLDMIIMGADGACQVGPSGYIFLAACTAAWVLTLLVRLITVYTCLWTACTPQYGADAACQVMHIVLRGIVHCFAWHCGLNYCPSTAHHGGHIVHCMLW
jgi:hypothetical protein